MLLSWPVTHHIVAELSTLVTTLLEKLNVGDTSGGPCSGAAVDG